MKSSPIFRLCMVGLGLLILLFSPVGGAAQAATTSCGSWSIVNSPSPPINNIIDDHLFGVAAVSANDIWAVGAGSYAYNNAVTLTEHWDGTQWSVVNSPNVSGYNNLLYAVAAVSTNDVWAVGISSQSDEKTLIEHWDGTQWSIVPSPNAGASNLLAGIAVVSATDIWAVGTGSGRTLAEHWDGTQWSIVLTPHNETGDEFLGVTALASNDVWAVGDSRNHKNVPKTLVEHWDGTKWSVVKSPNIANSSQPNVPPNDTYLVGVAASSATDIWAVGYYNRASNDKTLVEHWDGTKWSVVKSPNPGPNSDLIGVAAVSSTNVWAVGFISKTSHSNPDKTLIEHWNGTKWSVIKSPSPSGSSRLNLSAIAAVAGSSNLWTVGAYYDPSGNGNTLVESYC